jgi:hypothetical protein
VAGPSLNHQMTRLPVTTVTTQMRQEYRHQEREWKFHERKKHEIDKRHKKDYDWIFKEAETYVHHMGQQGQRSQHEPEVERERDEEEQVMELLEWQGPQVFETESTGLATVEQGPENLNLSDSEQHTPVSEGQSHHHSTPQQSLHRQAVHEPSVHDLSHETLEHNEAICVRPEEDNHIVSEGRMSSPAGISMRSEHEASPGHDSQERVAKKPSSLWNLNQENTDTQFTYSEQPGCDEDCEMDNLGSQGSEGCGERVPNISKGGMNGQSSQMALVNIGFQDENQEQEIGEDGNQTEQEYGGPLPTPTPTSSGPGLEESRDEVSRQRVCS